jgi:hypothetical protein
MALILLAALLGLLGPGPISYSNLLTPDGKLAVEYYAIERYEAPTQLRIRIRPAGDEITVRLAISRTFTDNITPQNIAPEPESVEIERDRIVYSFRVSELDERALVIYRFKHNELGRLRYEVGLADGASLAISQFICP